jgi:hypothetical protein
MKNTAELQSELSPRNDYNTSNIYKGNRSNGMSSYNDSGYNNSSFDQEQHSTTTYTTTNRTQYDRGNVQLQHTSVKRIESVYSAPHGDILDTYVHADNNRSRGVTQESISHQFYRSKSQQNPRGMASAPFANDYNTPY